MTQNAATIRSARPGPPLRRPAPTLSLGPTVPADWHDDRPAFAGDPFMDWESRPEPPREPRWVLVEASRTQKH